MEAIGTGASTIVLVEISAKVLSHLCGYISKVKNADKRWQRLSVEVEATRQLLAQLQTHPDNEKLDTQDNEYAISQENILDICLNDIDTVRHLLEAYKR